MTGMDGRHVLITGGGSGVGAAMARAFFEAGARVTIVGRRESALAEQQLPYEVADVTDAGALKTAVDAAQRQRGPVTVSIANAGDADSSAFDRTSPERFQAMISVNLLGVFNLWQACLPGMRDAGWGRMIAISSIAGLRGYPYVAGYCAAKHGVVGLTRSLAVELATSGITVNAICPGYIETPLMERSIARIVDKTGISEEQARASLLAGNPQGRCVGVDEVAETALWLCSDSARSVNGHALALSGGEV